MTNKEFAERLVNDDYGTYSTDGLYDELEKKYSKHEAWEEIKEAIKKTAAEDSVECQCCGKYVSKQDCAGSAEQREGGIYICDNCWKKEV